MRLTLFRSVLSTVILFSLLTSCSPGVPEEGNQALLPTPAVNNSDQTLGEVPLTPTEKAEIKSISTKKRITTPSGVTIIRVGEVGGTNVYRIKGTPVLIPQPELYGPQQQKIIDRRIAQYKKLIKQNPGINFHAFYLDLINYSPVHPLVEVTPRADGGRSFAYFSANKPEQLKLGSFLLTNFQDQLDYYYRTDHHWNVRGMLQGYEKVYALLKESYPDISPMVKHDKFYTFPDIKYLGRWSQLLNYRIKADPFEVVLLNLPPYKIYNSDGEEITYNHAQEYLAGKYSTATFTDHYGLYFGEDIDFLDYVSKNGSKRNLLIIGDSYTNAIEPLLAAHYHHTYCVDIRKYPDYRFSLSEFISKHPVDDVLVLGGAYVLYYEWRATILP